jgi:superfamily I DNA/RNA helicase
MVVDATDIQNLASRIEDAFKAWARFETNLAPKIFSELLEALMPKLRLMRCTSAEVDSEQRRLIQITLDQRMTLLGLLENDRVLVEGTAGSGKTLLALEFAIDRAFRGERVLFLCYNRNLCAWLQEQVRMDPRNLTIGRYLEVSTFHSFAKRIAERAGVEFLVPNVSEQSFWDDEVPLILEQALEVLRSRKQEQVYDAVVVDEAQDFASDWWLTIESLASPGGKARLYAFLDMLQSVRGHSHYPPVPFPARFRLTTNCRNTKAIARSGASLAKVDICLLPGSPSGEAPSLMRTASTVAEVGLVFAEVRKLLLDGIKPSQIALIGPASHSKGALSKYKSIDTTAITDDAIDWRCGTGILVTTARAFKGLEADIVVMYGLAEFGALFGQVDLYVAWTRARHRLLIVCQGGSVRAHIEAALADAHRKLKSEEVG